jgi:hypothetical protein
MFSFFRRLFFFENHRRILGRWTIDTCQIKVNRKIDFSNEDHCGPCGYTSHTKAIVLYDPNKYIANK